MAGTSHADILRALNDSGFDLSERHSHQRRRGATDRELLFHERIERLLCKKFPQLVYLQYVGGR